MLVIIGTLLIKQYENEVFENQKDVFNLRLLIQAVESNATKT